MEHEAAVHGVGVAGTDDGERVPVVVLEARDEHVPIFVGPDQAHSIVQARSEVPFDRPLTHDLLLEMVTDFGGAIDGVRIDDLDGGTFYAKIDAEQIRDGERRATVFDARPSDGIALAVRVDCPITISDDVIDEAGQPIDDEGPDAGSFRIDDDRELT